MEIEPRLMPRGSPRRAQPIDGRSSFGLGVASLDPDDLNGGIEQAVNCLQREFRSTSGGSGWYHYLDDPEPGVTASAVGLFIHSLANTQFDRSDEIIEYLLRQQITADGSNKGGWSVRTTMGFPILESTAWVLRALARERPSIASATAIQMGTDWILRNQNADNGWGSYRGEKSRVFLTSLALLALAECGRTDELFSKGQRWLLAAQHPSSSAWGAVGSATPTILHTSFAVQALTTSPPMLAPNSVRQIIDWIMSKLEPASFVEKESVVEEYDVPYIYNGETATFQNCLPHFATPVSLYTILASGHDSLSSQVFDGIRQILACQRDDGSWELPRSPTRASVWAIWPFVAALGEARHRLAPMQQGTVDLLYDGCALVQTSPSSSRVTRFFFFRKSTSFWMKRHWGKLALWALIVLLALIAILLYFVLDDTVNTLLALVFSVILFGVQIIWSKNDQRQARDRQADE